EHIRYRMNRTTRFSLIVIAIGFCTLGLLRAQQVGPGVGADTEDPRMILREADQAIRKVQSLSYEASYQGTGSFSTQSPISTGQVKLSRLETINPLKAKVSARGGFLQTGSADEQPFQVAFDGKTISRIRSGQKALVYK